MTRDERAFQWMHRERVTKKSSIADLVGNPNSPKVTIPQIDAEIDGTNGSGGCDLGCANCHHYHETLPRSKEGTVAWDALMAEPVRKRL